MMMIMMVMVKVLTAEICSPSYTTSCGPVSVKGTKLGEREQCVEIRSGGLLWRGLLTLLSCYSRTVCVTGVENQEVEVCIVEYEPRVHQVMSVTSDDDGDH